MRRTLFGTVLYSALYTPPCSNLKQGVHGVAKTRVRVTPRARVRVRVRVRGRVGVRVRVGVRIG